MGMKLLNGAYTRYFNIRHRTSGHLFQGRYKAHLVEAEGHYAELSRYIHLNPVRAGMVEDPAAYWWSSFPGYCRASRKLGWVSYQTDLADFGPGAVALCRRRYAAFVRRGIDERLKRPWEKAIGGVVVGSQDFFDQVRVRSSFQEEIRNVPCSSKFVARADLDDVVAACAAVLGVDRSTWWPGRRSDSADRALAAYVCRRRYGYPGRQVAQSLGYRDGGSVTRSLVRVEAKTRLLHAASRLAREVEHWLGERR